MKAPITYIPGFILDPCSVFTELAHGLIWERRDNSPRHEYYCNDINIPYTYGRGRGVRSYHPKPFSDPILKIRKKLEELTSVYFEVCHLNRYLNQSDHLGWHSDDSPEMDDARPIAIVSVSLGVEREIWFREREGDVDNKIPEKLLLENGSLCLMAPGMQDAWQHRIPKASFQCGERISLTYRGYVYGAHRGA